MRLFKDLDKQADPKRRGARHLIPWFTTMSLGVSAIVRLKSSFYTPTSLVHSYDLLSGSQESLMRYSTCDNAVMVGFNICACPRWTLLQHPTQPRDVDQAHPRRLICLF